MTDYAPQPVQVIFCYRPGNSYALSALLGSLEQSPPSRHCAIEIAKNGAEVVTLLQIAEQYGRSSLVLWSFQTAGFERAQAELQAVRGAYDPANAVHIAGGVHASAEPETVLRAGFDLAVLGEGEQTLLDIAAAAVSCAGDDAALVRTAVRQPGTAWLEGGKPVVRRRAELINLDDFPPFAARHRRFGPIEITRGCIYACRFCQVPFLYRARFRHRSVEAVCRHVEALRSRSLMDVRFLTPSALSYGSADVTVQLGAVERLLTAVRETIGREGRIFLGSFPSEIRPEHVSRPALQLLKRFVANNNLIIGAQSGSPRIWSF